jgi:subtilisin
MNGGSTIMAGTTIDVGDAGDGAGDEATLSDQTMATTGRYVVVLSDDVHGDEGEITDALRSVAGATSVTSTSDTKTHALDVAEAAGADAAVFVELGVAVVSAAPDQVGSMTAAAAEDPRIIAVEPERVMYAIDDGALPTAEYVRGYRDGVADLAGRLSGAGAADAPAEVAAVRYADTATLTWGLQATAASTSSRHGDGVRIAVLDTGMDLGHPDFAGRAIVAHSFIAGESPQDGYGHGTHCVGTSCGPAQPPMGRRYGVASDAEILVGKVLSNQGSGTDTNILAGMSWALAQGCQVISMSLGANVRTVSAAYETAARRALAAGTLIVAAAGNNAKRALGDPGFVGRPANSPSIMAVAAIDAQLAIASFSARSNPVAGGQVDIAAPGVAVYSAWPMPTRYNTISGTSMATPHVAGLAALWSEATGATGPALWSAVVQAARRLQLPSVDVGVGLAQAPQ